MLFDLLDFHRPLPDGVVVFASGASREPEIRGFARVGIPVGVSVNHLNEDAIAALIEAACDDRQWGFQRDRLHC